MSPENKSGQNNEDEIAELRANQRRLGMLMARIGEQMMGGPDASRKDARGSRPGQPAEKEPIDQIHDLVQAGIEISDLAYGNRLDTDTKIINQEFKSQRGRSRIPFARDLVDNWKDGHQTTRSSNPLQRHKVTERGGAELRSKSIRKRGELTDSPTGRGWMLFHSSDRGRDIGVVLTLEGRVGIFDLPKKSPSMEHRPYVISQNQGIYTKMSGIDEGGVLYLDAVADYLEDGHTELPRAVQLVLGEDANRHLGGLRAIATGLVDFAHSNNLD